MSFATSSVLSMSISLYLSVLETEPEPEPDTINLWLEWHPANFETVIETHQNRLYRFIYSMVNDADLAQDLTQDTFLLAYRHLQKRTRNFNEFEFGLTKSENNFFQPNMTAWLYTIARNTTLSELKRRKKFRFLPFSGLQNRAGDQAEVLDPADNTADSRSGNAESWLDLKDELQKVIQRVGPNKITALLLFLDGFSYLEICQITGDSLANVKVKIFRAKILLREVMEKQVSKKGAP